MRVITVPEEVAVKFPGKQETKSYQFKGWLVDTLESSDPKGIKQIRQLCKVIDKIEASNGSVSLEDTEYQIVSDILESAKFYPIFARQLMPFFDAVESAEEVKK